MIALQLDSLRKKSVPQLLMKRKKAETGLRDGNGRAQRCEALRMV